MSTLAPTWRRLAVALCAAALVLGSPAGEAARSGRGPTDRGWTVHVDNDLFAFADEDRDYTAGVTFTLGGDAARTHALSLEPLLDWADGKSGFERLTAGRVVEGHALEAGLVLFTPQDLSAREPIVDDRPYANLLYLAGSTLSRDETRGVAYQSSLTLGVLGLPAAETLHRAVHDVLGSAEPRGYANQISAGGEPTARYAVTRRKLLSRGSLAGRPYVLTFGADASVGYLTEAGAELALRWGRPQSAWWSAPPVASDYAGHPPIRAARARARGSGPELLIDAGVKLRMRLYNSFLQGQLRDSPVTYSWSELEHVLIEAWLGVTTVFAHDLSVSYTVRYQSEEIETGSGAHGFTWAGIGVAQRF